MPELSYAAKSQNASKIPFSFTEGVQNLNTALKAVKAREENDAESKELISNVIDYGTTVVDVCLVLCPAARISKMIISAGLKRYKGVLPTATMLLWGKKPEGLSSKEIWSLTHDTFVEAFKEQLAADPSIEKINSLQSQLINLIRKRPINHNGIVN